MTTNRAAQKPNWTVMVYMVADTGDNFYHFAMEDIISMTKAKFDDRVKVVVHADAPPPWRTKCWEVTGASKGEEGKADAVDCHDTCLLDFVDRCVKEYQSDYYLLVLWGHGEGIDWKEKVLANRPAGSEIIGSGKRFAPGSAGTLEVAELGKALSQMESLKGISKETVLVGFDACLMAMVEVYGEIEPYVGWVVAANDEIPDAGWPYEEILTWLGQNPGKEPKSLGTAIVNECRQSYSDNGNQSDVSFSLCQLSQETYRPLQLAVGKLAEHLTKHLKSRAGLKVITKARDFAEDLRERAYVDLHAFCMELQRQVKVNGHEADLQDLADVAGKVVQALNEFVTKSVFSDEYPYKYWEDARAVSICFPEAPDLEGTVPGQQINWGSYKQLAFSDKTRWPAFVRQFVDTPRIE